MATVHEQKVDTLVANDQELFDQRVAELLQSAETRLRQGDASHPQSDYPLKQPRLNPSGLTRPYIATSGGISRLDSSRLLEKDKRELSNEVCKVKPSAAAKKAAEKNDAGPEWFNMPRTDPALKRDLQLLKMRSVLDPKRHYNEDKSSKKSPEFAQMGTIIEGPTEFYSARLPNRERRSTFLEEVLAQEYKTGRFKKKYGEIQVAKTSGKKAYYKALKAKRNSKNTNG